MPPSPDEILSHARALSATLVSLRRRLHRVPEVGLWLPKTQETLLQALSSLPLSLYRGSSCSSVIAILEGDCGHGRTLILRADMDALPVEELSEAEYRSENAGVMHACGHDAHMSMLVGAARLLADMRSTYPGRVVFAFQPAEEVFDGAQAMLSDGLLEIASREAEPPTFAFALHQAPLLPIGTVALKPGTQMASCDNLKICLKARGGHASAPHNAIDPTTTACEIVIAIQTMITREIGVQDPAVVTISSIKGGWANSVIPEEVILEGTIRTVSDETRTKVHSALQRLACHIAEAHRAEAHVRIDPAAPMTINNTAATEFVTSVAEQLFGQTCLQILHSPSMGSEDWSYILQQVPGVMAFLGTGPKDTAACAAPNHSPRMVLDEEALTLGAALHAAVALKWLTSNGS